MDKDQEQPRFRMRGTIRRIDKKQMDFLTNLEDQRKNYVLQLEEMFGPRDPNFVFGSIKRSIHEEGSPQTYFPIGYTREGVCLVDIQISPLPYDNQYLNQATWQIAHECVHLLDPCCFGGANVLEEGLATWFQDEERYHPVFVQEYIRRNSPHTPHYAEAKELVLRCMPHLIEAVRKIRSKGIRISDIEPRLLKAFLPNVDDSVVSRLCAPFRSVRDNEGNGVDQTDK